MISEVIIYSVFDSLSDILVSSQLHVVHHNHKHICTVYDYGDGNGSFCHAINQSECSHTLSTKKSTTGSF